jgi:PAS domain S-box-containing protein
MRQAKRCDSDRRAYATAGQAYTRPVVRPTLEDLRQSEERLHAVIESSPLAILELDLETRVIGWNPAGERIFGWTREELLGRTDLPMVPDSKMGESARLDAKVRAGETFSNYETVRQCKDGAFIDVAIAGAPVRDSTGRVVSHMIVYSDISELHRLNEELHARLEDLTASRARIVAAGDVERRRLERNLHDGAQQRLVTLAVSIRLALERLDDEPAAARELLAGAADELTVALEELRELARGLHPALLTEHGLGAAVESLAGRVPVRVEIAAMPSGRLAEPVEAAAYYVIAEALTNVAKHSQATTARVGVTATGGNVVVEVSDDGVGGAEAVRGAGICGLEDRVEALGGRFELTSPVGVGTTLRAEIPVHAGTGADSR